MIDLLEVYSDCFQKFGPSIDKMLTFTLEEETEQTTGTHTFLNIMVIKN